MLQGQEIDVLLQGAWQLSLIYIHSVNQVKEVLSPKEPSEIKLEDRLRMESQVLET